LNPTIFNQKNLEQFKDESEKNEKQENSSIYNFEEKYIRTASEKINELIMSRVIFFIILFYVIKNYFYNLLIFKNFHLVFNE